MPPTLHVVAGIIYNAAGEILLSSRPEGKAYAGYWEFAGGKVETGESEIAALQREFQEELGIHIRHATPYLAKIHAYEHATVHLRFYRVGAQDWTGEMQAREGQQFAWQNPAAPSVSPMLPANTHLLSVLSMPQQLSGSPKTSLRDETDRYRILPYPAPETENTMLTLAQLQQLGKMPSNRHVWVIVNNLAEFHAAQDASALIWCVENDEMAQTVLNVLQEGASLPIAIYVTRDLCEQYQTFWQQSGAQAVIENHEREYV
ncbi:NUDIX domain-containing protein [Neisseriaceae bacterium B1]